MKKKCYRRALQVEEPRQLHWASKLLPLIPLSRFKLLLFITEYYLYIIKVSLILQIFYARPPSRNLHFVYCTVLNQRAPNHASSCMMFLHPVQFGSLDAMNFPCGAK